MIDMHPAAAFAALAVILVWANRFCGGGFGWDQWTADRGGFLRGRPLYYAVPLMFGALGPVIGWGLAAWVAVGFLLWRLPGWYGAMDMGADRHSVARDAAVMFVRGILAFPAFVPLAPLYGPAIAILFTVGLAVLIVAAYWLGYHLITKPERWNWAELLCGVAWAIAVFAAYVEV